VLDHDCVQELAYAFKQISNIGPEEITRMRLRSFPLTAALAVAVIAGLMVPAADARSKRAPEDRSTGHVTAESRYGSQTITAPVRISAQGRREVRLPGGTWIECRRTCSETLRQETIDFWYIRSNPYNAGGDDGPGYLRFRWYW
jgi:hypothetical protein